ncbi:MAG TPA: hypothetical protein DFI01_07595 [Bacteroidales bacterium]|nr:hypothetical protein [Bacteroidales bacterium]
MMKDILIAKTQVKNNNRKIFSLFCFCSTLSLKRNIKNIMIPKYSYIVIEGNIGAGKTALATKIAKQYKAKLILESFENNPLLPKFYENPEKYSFPLELSFLASRYKQLKEEITAENLYYPFTIADYYFTKSLIFSNATLSDEEYKLYSQFFFKIFDIFPKPDIYIYLHIEPERLLQNIKKRGRNYEQSITLEYLQKIQENYFLFFNRNPENKYLVIDVNQIDFVDNEEDYIKVINAIFNSDYRTGINKVILC